jgi:hypothetical protein
MNVFRKAFSNRSLLILILLLAIGIISALLLAGKNSRRGAIDDAALESKATAIARDYGLIGEPIEKKAVRMSLGEWSKLIDAGYGEGARELGLTPDLPVFVLVILGDVEWKDPGGKSWLGSEAERFDNITIVLNANTGESIYVGSIRAGFPLPVPIP